MVWWGGWAFKVTKTPPPRECHLSLGGQTHNVESVLTSYVTLIYLLPHRDNL